MSSTNNTKRSRSNPLLLPYLTPELWSKVLEGLPYGNMHELITSDDPNLAILSKAMSHVETIVVTRPEDLDLALRSPSAGALAKVKKLTAVCWDDLGANPWYKRPEGAVPLHDLPIDMNLGQNLTKLISLVALMPNIQKVEAVGYGGCGMFCVSKNALRDGFGFLCHKLQNLADGWTGAGKGSKCVTDAVLAIFWGYESGKLPDHISLTWDDSWKDLLNVLCNCQAMRMPHRICHVCRTACARLPFRIVFALLRADELPGRLNREDVLSSIYSRPGGAEFLRQPSLIQGILMSCEEHSERVACSYRGEPIVPGRSGYKDGDSWKKIPRMAGAIRITPAKLELMKDLKSKYANNIDIDQVVMTIQELVKDSARCYSDNITIETLCGRPFVIQETADALNKMGIALPSDKFVIFPTSSIIHDSDVEEDWGEYGDMNGAPSDSEDEDE